MSVIRLLLLLGFASLWAMPASACYTGPMPLAFVGPTGELTKDSKRNLAYYADERGFNGQDRVLVIFYDGTPTRAADKTLRQDRQRSIRTYLRSEGVPTHAMSFVTRQRRMPSDLADLDGGFRPVATVELTVGCGN